MTDADISRERAWQLVTEHVQSESLRKHLLGVEAAVRGYAGCGAKDETAWGFVALIHDFDYEKYPDRENHPFEVSTSSRASATRNGSPARCYRTPTTRAFPANQSSNTRCLRATR
jgi:predicted hydrolase (HD superfamily)